MSGGIKTPQKKKKKKESGPSKGEKKEGNFSHVLPLPPHLMNQNVKRQIKDSK